MTKVVIQASHIRIDDETTHNRGDVVEMSDEQIKRLGNSVAPIPGANKETDGIPKAMQKKDAEIKALKSQVAALELDIIGLKDTIATNDAPEKETIAEKPRGRPAKT